MNRFFKFLFKFFLILYLVACTVLYFVQDKILFRPYPLAENHQFYTGEEVEIEVSPNIFLNCIWDKVSNSKGVVLYLHGNRGNNNWCMRQSQTMTGNGYDIFMVDYRGYGKSDGLITSQAQLFDDVQKVYNFLKQHYEESQIILTGYSLGTGMAAWLAANNRPQQLFLVAPYYSMINMKNRYAWFIPNFILKYPLCTNQYLTDVQCPVHLFHGTNDRVIPYDASEQLHQEFPEKTSLFTLRGEGHRGSIFNYGFRNRFAKAVKY